MNNKGIKEFYEVLLKRSSLYNKKLLTLRSKYDKTKLSEHETLKFTINDIIPLAKSEEVEFSVEDFINYEKNTNNKITVTNDDLLEDLSGGFRGKAISLGLCSLAIASGFIGSSASFAVGETDEEPSGSKVTTSSAVVSSTKNNIKKFTPKISPVSKQETSSSTVEPPPKNNTKKFTPKTSPIPEQDTTSSTVALPPKSNTKKFTPKTSPIPEQDTTSSTVALPPKSNTKKFTPKTSPIPEQDITSSTVAPPPKSNTKKFTPQAAPIPKQDTTSSTSTAQKLSLPTKEGNRKKTLSIAIPTNTKGEYKYPYRELKEDPKYPGRAIKGELKWIVLKEGAKILDFKKALLEEFNEDDLDTDAITLLVGNRTMSEMLKVDDIKLPSNVKNFSVFVERLETVTIYTQIQLTIDWYLNDEIKSSSLISKGIENGDRDANGSRYCFYKIYGRELNFVLVLRGEETIGDLRKAIAKKEKVDIDTVGVFLKGIYLNNDDRNLDDLKVKSKKFKDFECFNVSLNL